MSEQRVQETITYRGWTIIKDALRNDRWYANHDLQAITLKGAGYSSVDAARAAIDEYEH